MRRATLEVAVRWDGEPLPVAERAVVTLVHDARALHVHVRAPFHGDPPPPGPPGPTDGLWEHEVVELFLLGAEERYLEVELGPHGHHLVLMLQGERRVEAKALPLDYTAARQGSLWTGEARLPAAWLPPGLCAANAYAIHGTGAARRYAAAHAVPGPAPDFHRLACFRPLVWCGEPDRGRG